VAACAVTVRERGGEGEILVAFLVARTPVAPVVETLRLWLGEKLPDYMIPSRFVRVAALPLTPNGKLDRSALEQLEGEELAVGIEYAPAGNELERQLVAIWQTALRREPIGIRDNFFHLGGHSLLAVAILSKIKQRIRREVPLRWLFEHPTIEGLARQPMSFAQQGMWLVHQALADPAAYNQPFAWHVSGRVDPARLRQALHLISTRHEILRTALVLSGDALVQQIVPAGEFAVPWR
jgi:hypothetical protein